MRDNVGREGSRNNGRNTWQKIVGCLVTRGLEYRRTRPSSLVQHSMQRVCRFIVAWVREEKKAPKNRRRKKEVEEADKVEVGPGVTVGSLRRFR